MSATTQLEVDRAVVARTGHDHLVEIYDTEEFLVGTVAGFLGPALNDGDAAVVVATEAHRRAFDAALRASGVDIAAAVATRRYLVYDAAERLEAFMVGGAPDPGRFADMIGGVIERATAGGRRVRIYGEMVSLLWDAGDVGSAIALEDMWNDLAAGREFKLLCAYPMRSFEDSGTTADFSRICGIHSIVIPPEHHAAIGGSAAQQRGVAGLHQETAALKADVARIRAGRILASIAGPIAGTTGPDPAQWDVAWSQPGLRSSPGPTDEIRDSPGGRLLAESLGTLSGRLRYA